MVFLNDAGNGTFWEIIKNDNLRINIEAKNKGTADKQQAKKRVKN